MKNPSTTSNTIKVCTGAGCKAWKSTKILALIWKNIVQSCGEGKVQVCSAPCMKRCGGGATVEMPFYGKFLKFRQPEEALQSINLFKDLGSATKEGFGGQPALPQPWSIRPQQMGLQYNTPLNASRDHDNLGNGL